jgi:hypothetical protein
MLPLEIPDPPQPDRQPPLRGPGNESCAVKSEVDRRVGRVNRPARPAYSRNHVSPEFSVMTFSLWVTRGGNILLVRLIVSLTGPKAVNGGAMPPVRRIG